MVNKLTNTVKPLDEVDKINEIIDALDDKQDTLVSGTNIKTINNNSILGNGNLTLDGLPSQTGNANKFLTTDGTDASWAAVPTRNIGEIVASTIPLTDAGLHLLDGALIQGSGIYSAFVTYIAGLVSTYPDLFCTEAEWQTSVTQYGVCGKFVYDATANTVRLPKITGIIEGTTDVNALGDLVEAGLPSIEHKHYNGVVDDGANIWRVTNQWGREGCSNGGSNSTTGYTSDVVDVENSIYGNSNTVQPQTIKAFYYIVIATSTKTDIQVDIDEIATDLNGKADVDLTNVPSSKGILQESYINGTSWYRVYSDGWIEQGGELTSVPQDTTVTVSLLKSYSNANYSVLIVATGGSRSSSQYMNGESVQSRSVDSFVMRSNDYTFGRIWRACGYIN